jgi:chromosomal replication initiation ATPase DnaA
VNQQLRLELRRTPPYRRRDFIVSPSNELAVRGLDGWPNWHAGCLALIGPEGSGKTHLARAWARKAGAQIVTAKQFNAANLAGLMGRPVLVEDADRCASDDMLFHLINMAGESGGGLLLTARTAPAEWKTALPDLRSRLNALPVAEIGAPDDAVLDGVLRKFFGEHNIKPADDLIAYLVRRIERSAPAARAIVEQLDEAAGPEHRPVTRVLARQILEIDGEGAELIE